MCGFLFIHHKSKNDYDTKNIKNAANYLKHRGPDDYQIYKDKKNFAIHYRLSIQDLTNKSSQPMEIKYNNENFIIIYNGEIYNLEKLKKQIIEKFDYKFKTNGDTEVVLVSYLLFGTKCLEKFEGMFSFVIWKKNTNEIFFARDAFGQKPLYYFSDKKKLVICSEIKPIINLLGKEKIKINKSSIKNYIVFNYFGESNSTFFKDIYQLNAGSYCKYNKKISSKRFFDYNFPQIKEKKIEKYKKVIEKVVHEHLIGDVKISIALSNGTDSKFILSLIKKLKKKVNIFSFKFKNFRSEDDQIISILKRKKLKLTTVKFDNNDTLNYLSKAIYANEYPIPGLPSLAMLKLFEIAKKNKKKVMLTGYGGDEAFFGYKIFKKKYLSKYASMSAHGENLDHSIFLKYKNYSKISGRRLSLFNLRKKYCTTFKIPKTVITNDKLSMYNSIETRTPYLDRRVFELSSQIYLNKKLRNQLTNKHFQKKIISENNFVGLEKKNFFKNKILKNNPQKKILNTKNINSKINFILKNDILNDFLSAFNVKSIKKKIDKFPLLKWQILNLYYFKKNFFS